MFIKTKIFLTYWLPVGLWATGIFYLSGLSHPPTPPRFPLSDKIIHIILFAVLGLLLLRALVRGHGWPEIPAAWMALFGVLIYGALDEFHQSFVPNRSVEWSDWVADVLGGSVPFLACLTRNKIGKVFYGHEQARGTTPDRQAPSRD